MTHTSNIFDFHTVIDRRNTASLKWDKYKGRDILPLWVADMDFKSPPSVLKALQDRVEHGIFGYAVTPEALIDITVSMLFEQYEWQVHPDWLVWLPGLVTGLNVTCRAVGSPGDDVLTAIPVYPPFLSAPLHFQQNIVTVPLESRDGRWEFDFDSLENAITPKTRLFMLCNPHNPVGRVFTRDELLRIAAICEKHDLIICSDEIHCGMILDSDKFHIPFAVLGKELQDRTITLMAPSKTYNIAGLGCSFAVISNAQLRRSFVAGNGRHRPPSKCSGQHRGLGRLSGYQPVAESVVRLPERQQGPCVLVRISNERFFHLPYGSNLSFLDRCTEIRFG